MITNDKALTRANLRTPKAAALAGIAFCLLLMVIIWLLQRSMPGNPLDAGEWISANSATVTLALNLVPFAGIAFLWFIGVLRDRLEADEDRFFATVFLGSALVFLAMLFAAAALIGAMILTARSTSPEFLDSATLKFGRAAAFIIMNVYAVKMAGVFMISTSTVLVYTRIAPRWIAFVGYVLALGLLFGSSYVTWSIAALPIWVLLVSTHILIENYRSPQAAS
jgi:hypothetical protein